MFERFTNAARRTVVQSQVEARTYLTADISTVCLLLALLRLTPDHPGVQILLRLGVSLEDLVQQLEGILEAADKTSPPFHMPFADSTKKALELSLREALRLGCNYVGSMHLMLALIREEGNAAKILAGYEVTLEGARKEAAELVLEDPERNELPAPVVSIWSPPSSEDLPPPPDYVRIELSHEAATRLFELLGIGKARKLLLSIHVRPTEGEEDDPMP